MQLTSSGWRPGMVLNILYMGYHPNPQQTIPLPKVSMALGVKNPVRNYAAHFLSSYKSLFWNECDLDSRAPGHLARPVGSNPEGIILWTRIWVKMEILMHTKCTHLKGKQSGSSLGFFLSTTNTYDFSGQSCPWLPLRNIKWVVYFYFLLYVLSLKVLKQ